MLFLISQIGFGALLDKTIDLLEPADQPLALASDAFEVVVGELAPAGLQIALDLLLAVFYVFPVHLDLPVRCDASLASRAVDDHLDGARACRTRLGAIRRVPGPNHVSRKSRARAKGILASRTSSL